MKIVGLVLVLLTVCTFGQVPSQGLVMWDCFTGNNVDSCNNITFIPQQFGSPNKYEPDRFSADSCSFYTNYGNAAVATNCTALPSGSNSRTISMWVCRLSTYNMYGTFIYYGKKKNGNYLNFGVSLSATHLYIKNGTDSLKITAYEFDNNLQACFPANTWKHVALVINKDTTIFYQDGKEWGRKVIKSWSTLTDSLIIGGMSSGTDGHFLDAFQGRIDDIAIYDKALTLTQIKRLYTSKSYRNIPPRFTSTPVLTALIGEQYRYQPLFSDSSILYLVLYPAGMTFINKVLLWTPNQTGNNSVALLATDNAGDTTYHRFSILVDAVSSCRNLPLYNTSNKCINENSYNAAGRFVANQAGIRVSFKEEQKSLKLR